MKVVSDKLGERTLTLELTEKELLMLYIAHCKQTTEEIIKYANAFNKTYPNLSFLTNDEDLKLNEQISILLGVDLA